MTEMTEMSEMTEMAEMAEMEDGGLVCNGIWEAGMPSSYLSRQPSAWGRGCYVSGRYV